MGENGLQGRNWVLAAMIFAVAMTFIDQTIVSIAVRSSSCRSPWRLLSVWSS